MSAIRIAALTKWRGALRVSAVAALAPVLLVSPTPASAGDAQVACLPVSSPAPRDVRHEPDEWTAAQIAESESLLRTAETTSQLTALAEAVALVGPAARITVHVHVHVIRSKTAGAVSGERIQRQIKALNRAHAGRQSARSSTSPFRFKLVSVDRTRNGRWYRMREGAPEERRAMKALRRGDASDLNLYVVKGEPGILGWATQPTEYRVQPTLDGVVMARNALPGGRGRYADGDAAVHETGHWLGLFHTFAGRCGGRGDLVTDTPAEARPSYACPTGRDTCAAGRKDPVRNFMNYSYDSCMNQFTSGQVKRMTRSWTALRAYGG